MNAVIATAASGDTQLVAAPGANKKIRVHAYTIVCDGAVAVKFRTGTSADLTGAMSFAANGGVSPPWVQPGHFDCVVNEALNINLSGAVGVRGHLTYSIQPG